MIIGAIELVLRIFYGVLLSTVYASLTVLLVFVVSKTTRSRWPKRMMEQKLSTWFTTTCIIFGCLIAYSFSYWQDTGLGETHSLPVGYGQRIYNFDEHVTSFFPDLSKTEFNKDNVDIETFAIKNNILCAGLSNSYSSGHDFDYIVCNLQERKNRTFSTEAEYTEYAKLNGLPPVNEFYDFKVHLKEYLERRPFWKKWLVP